MSNVGILSNEYKQATELATSLDDAVSLLRAGELPAQKRLQVSIVLTSLSDLLDPVSAIESDGKGIFDIPVSLVTRLRQEARTESTDRVGQINHLAGVMRDRDEAVAEADINALDELAKIAASEAAEVYRRMVRT